MFRTQLLTVAVVLLAAGLTRANETEFSQIHRLTTAMKEFRYPDNGRGRIVVWRQATPETGRRSCTFADNRVSLHHALNAFDDRCKPMDLENVAILSKGGRTIEFVNVQDPEVDSKLYILEPGHLVILMSATP